MDRPSRSMYMDIVERRALAGGQYRVTIAANEKVRQPPELCFGGLSTDNYSRNPVVMWAHDAVGRSPSGGPPIGRTLNLTKTPDGRIVADFEFLSDDAFVQRVKNAWDKGFLQAASISWLPVESVPTENGLWRDTRSELLEWSIVSVPADPEALRESHRRMMAVFIGEPSSGSRAPVTGEGTEPLQRSTQCCRDAAGHHMPVDIRVAPRSVKALCPSDINILAETQAPLREVTDGPQRHGRSEPGPDVRDDTEDEHFMSDLVEIGEAVAAISEFIAGEKEES